MKNLKFITFILGIIALFFTSALSAQGETEFYDNGIVFPKVSATSVTSPVEGQVIYNTDTDELAVYNGTAWVSAGATGFWKASSHGITNTHVDNVGIGANANSGTTLFVQGDYNEDPFRVQLGIEGNPDGGNTKLRLLAKYNSIVFGSSWSSIDSSHLDALWSNYKKNYFRDSLQLRNPAEDPAILMTKGYGMQIYDSNGDETIDLNRETGFVSAEKFIGDASLGEAFITDLKLKKLGSGPAGPEILFMDDNSITDVAAAIKVTNSTGGGNNHNMRIENRSIVGDISFSLNGATNFRMGNGSNLSYVNLTPWIDNSTDLGSTSKRWENIYSYDIDIKGLASLDDLLVSEEASFGKGLISSDPIRLKKFGNGPAGPEIQFMVDNSTSTVAASIKVTNSTGGGNDHNMIFNNLSPVGDITFIADDGVTHFRMSNSNNYSYVTLSPWQNNTTDLGSDGKRWKTIYSNNVLNSSDVRLKKNINTMSTSVLPDLMKLETTTYNYKSDEESTKKTIGFLAQEVEKINPEWVVPPATENGHYLINYNNFTVLAIKAIQEQQEMIDMLKVEIESLKKAKSE